LKLAAFSAWLLGVVGLGKGAGGGVAWTFFSLTVTAAVVIAFFLILVDTAPAVVNIFF
jgi:hypothetical protein